MLQTPSSCSFTHFCLVYSPPSTESLQGQATDIAIQAEEILKLKRVITDIYVNHTGQSSDVLGKEACNK